MKFSIAAVTALTLSGASAFTPAGSTTTLVNTALHMSAVETKTYTFAKSEEIFAEAQNVSYEYIPNSRSRAHAYTTLGLVPKVSLSHTVST
jgi:hypothetical protein